MRFLSGTMLSRLFGLVRDIAMAAAFGSDPLLAAFFVAFRFANLPRRLIGEGAMHSAFIPLFEALRKEDQRRAGLFSRDLLLILGGGLIFFILLAEGGLYLIAPAFSAGARDILDLTRVMLPSLLFICLYGINQAYLNCLGVYFLPSAASTLFNIVWIVGIALLWDGRGLSQMAALGGVIVIAFCAQWLVTLPQVIRSLKSSLGGSLFCELGEGRGDLRSLGRSLLLGIAGVAATQINGVCDSFFSWAADSSGPAYLWYAIRIQQLPLALFGVALSGALLPPLARAVKSGDVAGYKRFLTFAHERAIAIMTPTTMLITTLGLAAVNLIYCHGSFTPEAAVKTAHCLVAYGFGLLPMTLIMIQASAFYAHGDYRTPALASGFSVVVNIIFNAVLVFGFALGPIAVALSTSLAAYLQSLFLAYRLKREGRGIALLPLLWMGGKYSFASKVAATLTVGLSWWFFGSSPSDLPTALIPQCLHLAAQTACFAAAFGLVLAVIYGFKRLVIFAQKKPI